VRNTMNQRRILVTGAGGMVGSYVREVFGDGDLVLTDIIEGFSPLDVRDPVMVQRIVAEVRPHLILHLAAATDVDRCEQTPDQAFHANAIGTQNVALACQSSGAELVYISTAGVFSGEKPEPYTEFDLPGPVNAYGQSKLAGEQIVASILQRYYIVRAGWMIGGGQKDKKFVGKIVQLIQERKQELSVVHDKFGSPTYAKDFLGGIRALITTGYYGLYHMVNSGVGSRYDVALVLRELLGCPDVKILPVSSAHFPLPAPRARSEAMRNLKIELLGLHKMRPWEEAVREYVSCELKPILGRS